MSELRTVLEANFPTQETLSCLNLTESRCQGDKKACILHRIECISASLIFHKDAVIYSGYLTIVSHIHIG